MLSGTLNARAYSFFDTLAWIALLNLLWIASALLGLGVLGAGPATAAAQILVRKRVRGEAAPLVRGFAAEYVRNFGRANVLALPVMAAAGALVLNWNYFSRAEGVLAPLMAVGIFVSGVFLAGAACYLFPMYARYELPLARYLLMSPRFAVRHLAGTVILLFISAAVAYAGIVLPGLIPFFSVGLWLFLTGWLCDRFFTANDDAVAGAAEPAPDRTLQGAST
ncbi:YesL family protein [Arthrobacter sp. C152]